MAIKTKVLSCTNCGASITVKALGHSVTAVCGSCGSVIDLLDPQYQIISKAHLHSQDVLIPLGQRGFLKGREWEVIGFIERQDVEYSVNWFEYLLFNPRYGFRWLTESNGHWNIVATIKERPQLNHKVAQLYERKYDLYNKGKAEVKNVLGEFYWRVKVGDISEVSDYIAPPFQLSRERVFEKSNPGDESASIKYTEEIWSLAEYIEPHEIEAAFGLEAYLPNKLGVAPNQPSEYVEKCEKTFKLWLLFSVILAVVQIIHVITAKNATVYNRNLPYQTAQVISKDLSGSAGSTYYEPALQKGMLQLKEFVTPSFDLKDSGNLEVMIGARLDNSWMYVEGELVEETKSQSRAFTQNIEYYSGYESGEHWTEGNLVDKTIFSKVPAGRYHVAFQPASHETAFFTDPKIRDVWISVKRNTIIWSNCVWGFLLLSLPPLYCWYRRYCIEVQRWSNSEFSPYEE